MSACSLMITIDLGERTHERRKAHSSVGQRRIPRLVHSITTARTKDAIYAPSIKSKLRHLPNQLAVCARQKGDLPQGLDEPRQAQSENARIGGIMPTIHRIAARTERHCQPCEFHKLTGMLHVRCGPGGYREYACTHPHAFEPLPQRIDPAKALIIAKLQAMNQDGRPIGKTENQPSWCPLKREPPPPGAKE